MSKTINVPEPSDPCEVCGVEEGKVVNNNLWVCKKCNKKIKKGK